MGELKNQRDVLREGKEIRAHIDKLRVDLAIAQSKLEKVLVHCNHEDEKGRSLIKNGLYCTFCNKSTYLCKNNRLYTPLVETSKKAMPLHPYDREFDE